MKLRFITHADVQIDPDVPVPEWGLNDRGRERHAALARRRLALGAIWASDERKAQDGALILAEAHDLKVQTNVALREIDRSATGFRAKAEFEAIADRFFAHPDTSPDGWERAVDAQTRIVAAVQSIVAQHAVPGDVAVVAHGGVGALFLAWLAKAPISRRFDQSPTSNGGNMATIQLPDWTLIHGWEPIEQGI